MCCRMNEAVDTLTSKTMRQAVQLMTRPVDGRGGCGHPQGAALAVKDHVIDGRILRQQQLTGAVGQLCPMSQAM